MNATICFNSVGHCILVPLKVFCDLQTWILLFCLGCGVFASTQPMISWSYQAAAIAKFFFAVFHQLHLSPWEQLKMKKTGICIVLSISDVCGLLIVLAEHNMVIEGEIETPVNMYCHICNGLHNINSMPRWYGQTLCVGFNKSDHKTKYVQAMFYQHKPGAHNG